MFAYIFIYLFISFFSFLDNNNNAKAFTNVTGESEINILTIFDDKNENANIDDEYATNEEPSEFNVLTFF